VDTLLDGAVPGLGLLKLEYVVGLLVEQDIRIRGPETNLDPPAVVNPGRLVAQLRGTCTSLRGRYALFRGTHRCAWQMVEPADESGSEHDQGFRASTTNGDRAIRSAGIDRSGSMRRRSAREIAQHSGHRGERQRDVSNEEQTAKRWTAARSSYSPSDTSTRTSLMQATRGILVRSLAAALLITITGCCLGAVAFVVKHASMRPYHLLAARTATGWRISGQSGLKVSSIALAGDYLAVAIDQFVFEVDLRTGQSRELDWVADGYQLANVVQSDRYVVWASQSADSSTMSAFDVRSNRRSRVYSGRDEAEPIGIWGSLLVWVSTPSGVGGTSRLLTTDLTNGRESVVASFPSDTQSPLVSGSWLLWFPHPASATGSSGIDLVEAKNLANGRQLGITPPATRGISTVTCLAWGQWLIWEGAHLKTGSTDMPAYCTLTAQSLQTGKSLLIARTPWFASPVVDQSLVVWLASAPSSRRGQIVGRRLGGGRTFVITRTADIDIGSGPRVSDGTVAWINGSRSTVETVRLPSSATGALTPPPTSH